MEVASPLTFAHVKAGSKRRFACSPLDSPAVVGIEANVDDYAMDDCTDFGHSFKKRRCDDVDINCNSPSPPQPFGSSHSFNSSFSVANKRYRNDEPQDLNGKYLKSIIDSQSAEIVKLKEEKQALENSCKELSASHDKIINENKVLKKVLSIKQERQDQFVAELENARHYKEQAEHLIAVLRQHLQTQQSHDNNFMGYTDGGPPPNVF
mmetsp:Transcript_11247/g.21038  ORF Transcript_11247/g.21038 Transcript_11247/m.21038 type:complete len:208 (+) Transcript_11247:156-779(+)